MILHAQLTFGKNIIIANDAASGHKVGLDGNMALSLGFNGRIQVTNAIFVLIAIKV
ncbi:MAG TPA: hypothetical protein VNE41_01145 [Chitinophagaceae bacterium]|nr:hypothetical protein [Chitinophagaceae bacterium]